MLKKQLKCKLVKEVYELRALGHVTCMNSHLFLPCLQFLLPFRVVAFHGESAELFYLVHLEILWRYHLRTLPIRVYYHNRHFQLCCRPVVVLSRDFQNTSGNFGSPRGFMRLWTRKIWVLEWQSKLWPHCNVGRLQRKRTKMATELELAEEMSNSSPERAMELLSSIGEP